MSVCVCVCVQTIFDRKALWLIHKKKKSTIRMDPPANVGHAGSIPGWGMKTPTCRGATKPACDNEREASLLR